MDLKSIVSPKQDDGNALDARELLTKVVHSIIDNNETDAETDFHNYLVQKIEDRK